MRKKILITISVVAVVAALCNYPTTHRYGINGIQFHKNVPLYVKASGFLYRDWSYRDIVRGIVRGEQNQTSKALAIFGWVRGNIMAGVPQGLKTVDSHPLDIIIRQYAAGDQMEDIFTILCSYAGMQAFYGKCYNSDRSRMILLSFVKASGRLLVFDVYNGKYFINTRGTIASVDDCVNGNIVLSPQDMVVYKEFLDNIRSVGRIDTARSDAQMPLRRIALILKNLFTGEADR